jgi:hypothetical protein
MPPAARDRDRNTIGHAVAALRTNPGHQVAYDHRPSQDAACPDSDPQMCCYRSPVRCPSREQTRRLGG